MTLRYVGIGGNDSNSGLTWALRKLTLNGVEDTPVEAGDTVYVGAGTYREQLTVDVSGSSGNPITYIGDYDGSHTDGTGGVVRITGSDDDKTATRSYCITMAASNKNYRTFKNLVLDMTTSYCFNKELSANDLIIDGCYIDGTVYWNRPIASTIKNCFVLNISSYSTSPGDYAGAEISNCIFYGTGQGISLLNTNNITVKNCLFYGKYEGIRGSIGANGSGNVIYCYNSIFYRCTTGLSLQFTSGNDIVEDYNTFYGCTNDRVTVSTGAHSVNYPPLFDTRWFFESVAGGSMLMPFDLASYSQLINLAGTSPTTADMRGTTIIGDNREWGALEYDPDLDIEPGSGGGGGSVKIVPLGGVRL